MTHQNEAPKWIDEHIPQELSESSVFKFKVALTKDNIIEFDILPALEIEYDSVEKQMEDISSQYAYYAMVYSELKHNVSILERKAKARRGVLTREATNISKDSKAKLTSDQVKSVIEEDEVLNKMETQVATAQKWAGKMYHMTVALQIKADMLRSLCGVRKHDRDLSR